MSSYQYIARTPQGREITGVMLADNEAAVIRSLDERQLYPVRVLVQAATRRQAGGRIGLRDLSLMFGQLADLLRSGVPLLRSLETLVRASANRRLSGVVSSVHAQVSDGKSLAESMSAHPKVFNSLQVAMVRAGERGGFLEDVLTNLGEYLDRADDLRSKVRGAMVYPLILVSLGVVAILFILLVVVPKFQGVLSRVALPLPTKVLFALTNVLREHSLAAVAGVVLAAAGASALLRSQAGRTWWDSWQLKIPVAGNLIRGLCITRFCRILGTMLASGVPILQALSISKDAIGSLKLMQNVETAIDHVREGNKLAPPLAAGGLFPADVVEMIAVAEESNQLEKVLRQGADNTERRVNRQVDMAVRIMEPLILVVLALVIAFVAVGLLYPIFTMAQALQTR
jgi:general secretion pathway protein F/type IV pilus assembly protein PilC